jgi:hypothetical protein
MMSLPTKLVLRGPATSELLGAVRVAVADGRDVVDERIEPDVHDVFGIERQRDAPGEGRPGHREVLQPARDEAHDLVAPRLWLDELRVRFVVLEQAILIGREAEEPVVLADELHVAPTAGALSIRQLLLGVERLVGDAVPAFVVALVEVAAVLEHLQEGLRSADVAILCGPDEVVVGDVEHLPRVHELRGDRIHP